MAFFGLISELLLLKYEDSQLSFNIGSNFFIKLVSSHRATAYGNVLSKNIGSSFSSSLNLFSSQALIKFLYHFISANNLYHSSLSAGLPSNAASRIDRGNHIKDSSNRYKDSTLSEKKMAKKNQTTNFNRTHFSILFLFSSLYLNQDFFSPYL